MRSGHVTRPCPVRALVPVLPAADEDPAADPAPIAAPVCRSNPGHWWSVPRRHLLQLELGVAQLLSDVVEGGGGVVPARRIAISTRLAMLPPPHELAILAGGSHDVGESAQAPRPAPRQVVIAAVAPAARSAGFDHHHRIARSIFAASTASAGGSLRRSCSHSISRATLRWRSISSATVMLPTE